MIKKLSTITLAGIITTAGFVATSPAARSADLETGPCIIAVSTDDPTITAQRGDCSGTTTEEELPAPPYSVLMENNVYAYDASWNPLPVHVTAVNQTSGDVVADRVCSAGENCNFSEWVTLPNSESLRPSYFVTVTVEGQDYSYTLTPDLYAVRDDQEVMHVDTFLENGVFRQQLPPTN